jgi:cytochrome c-type biogenesis protein CcmH
MRFLLGVLMLMISGSALATIDVLQFKDEAQEQQFRQLTEELRCPKCQNNSKHSCFKYWLIQYLIAIKFCN